MKFSMIAALALAFIAPLAHAAQSDAAARDAIQKLARERKVEAFEKSPIPGYYQAVIGSQMLYVSEDGRYILQGTLYDADAKLDLTAMRMARVNVAKLDAYPDAKRIIFAPKSKPKYTVTVFTDIDCGYCRRLHQQMAEYNNAGITVEYLFFPRAGIGSESYDKAVSVWCAADRNAALTKAKNGEAVENKTCPNPIASQFDLGHKVGVSGTPAVIAEDGTQIGGYLTPEQMIARLDQIKASAKPN